MRTSAGHTSKAMVCFAVRRLSHSASFWIAEDTYLPRARRAFRDASLKAKVDEAWKELRHCVACPRQCGVDRTAADGAQKAICGVGQLAVVSTAFRHFGEEPCLVGTEGSGAVFFGGCNLRCVFCQNWDISQLTSDKKRSEIEGTRSDVIPFIRSGKGFLRGKYMNAEELAELFMNIQEQGGCHNLNLVTPEHVAPHIVIALYEAVKMGFCLPIVYNTSAYDSLKSLAMMDGLVDIYMPDFKWWTSESAKRYGRASDYPGAARSSIQEMHRQVGDLHLTTEGIAKYGLIVRHLIMPDGLDEAKHILQWLANEVSQDTYVNIMEQYRPQYLVGDCTRDGKGKRFAEIDRAITTGEKEQVYEYARAVGLHRFAIDDGNVCRSTV